MFPTLKWTCDILSTPLGLPVFFLLRFFWWVDLSSTLIPAEDPYFRHLSSFEPQKGQLWQRLGLATSRDGGFFQQKNQQVVKNPEKGSKFERMTLKKQLRSLGGKGTVLKCDHFRRHLLRVFFFFWMSWSIVVFWNKRASTCRLVPFNFLDGDLGFDGKTLEVPPWSSSICLGRESIILE